MGSLGGLDDNVTNVTATIAGGPDSGLGVAELRPE